MTCLFNQIMDQLSYLSLDVDEFEQSMVVLENGMKRSDEKEF